MGLFVVQYEPILQIWTTFWHFLRLLRVLQVPNAFSLQNIRKKLETILGLSMSRKMSLPIFSELSQIFLNNILDPSYQFENLSTIFT